MCNVNELQKKVEHAIECCTDHCVRCKECPYGNTDSMCSRRLMSDAQKVINYYKRKYEQSMLATTPMILHNPEPIRIEPVDVKATLKAIKAMNRMEKLKELPMLLTRQARLFGRLRRNFRMPERNDAIHIHLTVKAKECPYWNYKTHTCSHTCGTCTCLEEGNGIKYGELPGVMIDKDRYCLLGECDIRAEIVNTIDRANPVTAYWGIKRTNRGEGIYTCSNCNASVKYSIPVHVSALPEKCPICKAVMVNV